MATNLTSTTLTAAVTGGPPGTVQTVIALTSVTGVNAPTTPGGYQTYLLIDNELMAVQAVNTVALTATVERGVANTQIKAHANGQNVWFGQPQYFPQYVPYTALPSTQGRYRYLTTPGLSVALTIGNTTTDTAGGLYVADLIVSNLIVSTGGAVLNGSTVGTDSNQVFLYDYTGTLVASTAAAATSGAAAFQQRAWVQPTVLAPGHYWLAYQTNGTTDTFKTIAAATWVEVMTELITGTTIGSPGNTITIPTSFTANQGVIGYVY
jgi:hypothetical protein